MKTQKATLGGGCFWCLEAIFEQLRGVNAVQSGYAGGHVPNPTYEQVCTGTTGHAEVVQIEFDPDVISYRDLLNVFFDAESPRQRHRPAVPFHHFVPRRRATDDGRSDDARA
mgnify:CR=1 FL=1